MQQSIGAINPTYRSAARPRLHALPPLRQSDHTAWRELARLEQENRQLRWALQNFAHVSRCVSSIAEECATDGEYLADYHARETAPQSLTPDKK